MWKWKTRKENVIENFNVFTSFILHTILRPILLVLRFINRVFRPIFLFFFPSGKLNAVEICAICYAQTIGPNLCLFVNIFNDTKKTSQSIYCSR